MEKYDILIKNCQVLNPDMTVSSTCSVGIKDSWIKKIGPTDELMADSSASEIIDGKGKLSHARHDRWSYTYLPAAFKRACCR